MTTNLDAQPGTSTPARELGFSRRWLPAAILLAVTANAGIANSGEAVQSQASIRNTVEAFLTQQIKDKYPHHQIKVSRLDPRLKLAACQTPLSGFLPAAAKLIGNTSVGVRCNGDTPWTIYVPAFVKATHTVVVTTHPILRHSTISKDDIGLEEHDITAGTENYIDNPDDVLGMIAKRDLADSTPITSSMLNAPLLIHRGQQVIILAEGLGLEVRMGGIALMDGTEGQIVKAKNKLSNKTVEGRVIQPGIIKVNM